MCYLLRIQQYPVNTNYNSTLEKMEQAFKMRIEEVATEVGKLITPIFKKITTVQL